MSPDQYLAALPQGIESYPECLAKVTVVRSLVDAVQRALPGTLIPPVVRNLAALPPTEWISYTRLGVAHYTLCELFKEEDQYMSPKSQTHTFDSKTLEKLI